MNSMRLVKIYQTAGEISLCLVIFFTPLSNALMNIAIAASIFLWLGRKVVEKDYRLPKTHLDLILSIFLLISLISIFNATNINNGFIGIRKLLKYFILFFVMVDTLKTTIAIKRVAYAAILGLAIASLDGVIQYFTGKDLLHGRMLFTHSWYQFGGLITKRIKGSMRNPNDFACYLITLIPLLLCLILYYFKRSKMLIYGLIVLSMAFFCMVNTQYRGAALGFFAIMILLSFIKKDIRLIIILLLIILLLPFLLPKPLLYWLFTNPNPYDFFVEKDGRRWHWETAVNMIRAHPFIGIGINNFSVSYPEYKSLMNPFSQWYAHNGYLNIAAELGLSGLAIFILMLIILLKLWWRGFKNIKNEHLNTINLGVGCGFIGFLVAAVLESSFQYSILAVLFWFIVGLLICIDKAALSEN